MRKILYLLILSLVWVSCEKEVDIPIEYTEPKLVVNGLFNTDSLWEVEVSISQYIYESGSIPLIDDASVTITNSAGSSFSLINQGSGLYTSLTEKPATGEVYTLNVSHSDYDNVSSSNQVPADIIIQSMDWQQQVVVGGDVYKKINITFQDGPEEDYYMIRLAASYWDLEYNPLTGQLDSALSFYPMYFFSQSPAVENGSANDLQPSITFKDELFNGNQYTIDLLVDEYYFNGEKETVESIQISVSKISEEFYWYETSYQAYIASRNDKFFTQPVQVYTNIENGLGIFAGYSTKSDTIPVQ